VSNVPTAVDDATADTAVFLLLGVLRQFPKALASAQAGTFNSPLPLSNDPRGKLLGIIGMGGIGRALATRAKAFGMTVQYHNRNRLTPDLENSAQYVSYDELLRTSDVVSLNLPLNAKTKHLISTPAFKAMKSTAVLINTARGPVVDEQALIAALESGEIAGAGLDVYENEPEIPEGLLKSPNAFCLPHVGTLTVETQEAMEAACLNNIKHGLQKGKLGFTVPEQKHLIE
jgi:glyoxylate reductase